MSVELWSSPAFVEEAAAWVAEVCAGHGLTPTGEWEQPHCRVWSSAIRFETDGGRVWFKVNSSGTEHEAGLVDVLGRLVPGLVPDVLGADVSRSWSLTRDGGPMLRTVASPDELWGHWETLLPRYAEAQLALAAHRDELLATGVSAVGPAELPGLFRMLLDELTVRPPEQGGLTAEQAAGLATTLPEYDAWCAELAASPVPVSIQHDDLHSANVCWNGSMETARIIDWGDASVGHPFGTMLATLNSIAWHAGVFGEDSSIDDPRVVRVRDAYLEPFTRYADRAELVEMVTLARRTGAVTRAMSYQHAFAGEPRAAEAAEDWPVRGWLLELHEL